MNNSRVRHLKEKLNRSINCSSHDKQTKIKNKTSVLILELCILVWYPIYSFKDIATGQFVFELSIVQGPRAANSKAQEFINSIQFRKQHL